MECADSRGVRFVAPRGRRLLTVGVVLVAALFPYAGWAEDVGLADLVGAAPGRQSSTAYEVEYGYATALKQSQKLELNAIRKEKWALSDGMDLIAIGRLHADLYDHLEPGEPGQQEVATISQRVILTDHVDVELRELYVKAEVGTGLLQAGKQQVVWGNADGLRVLDVVDPFSFREFFLDEYEDARVPRWKLNYQVPLGGANLQLLWIPDRSYHDFADAGSSYEITSPRYVPQPAVGVVVNQPPADHPDRFFEDADYGGRVSGRLGTWDLSVAYLYRYDPIPVFFRSLETTPSGPVVNVDERYERTHLAGGTFSNAFGGTVVRGELGYSTDRYFLTTDIVADDGVFRTNELSYVLGLDFSQIQHSLISLQVFQSRLADAVPTLTRDPVDTTFTVLVNRTFRNEKWLAELLWISNKNDGDGLVRPKLSYKGIDNLSIWVGADVFYGDSIGTFGQFDRQDRLVVGFKWYQ